MATAVTKAQETAVSTDVFADMFDSAGDGVNFDSSEMQIPFIRTLQALSPQLNKNKPEFIKGATAGNIFNTVTAQVWDGETGIVVIPCCVETKYLEFVPVDQGGGFKGELQASNPDLQNTTRVGRQELLPNGNEVVKSVQYYVLVVDEEGIFQPAIVDFKSTMLKVSKRWNTQISMQKIRNPKTGQLSTPPIYATMWRLVVVEESNDKGSWNTWGVERIGLVSNKDIYDEAKLFSKSVTSGQVRVAADPEQGVGKPGPSSRVKEDEIPF